jgi:hypothetical protein
MTTRSGSFPYDASDVVRVSVYISDVEFPFVKGNQFGSIHMSESTKLEIPMCKVNFTDGIGWIARNPGALVEGAKMDISYTARNSDIRNVSFRINHRKITPSQTGDVIDIDGYLDVVPYWVETTDKVYNNVTSDEMLAKACPYLGLTYSGIPTNDSQTWYGGNRRWHTFLTETANRGYISDTSCMKRGVTLDKEFRYRDVSTNPSDISGRVFIGDARDGFIPAVSHEPKNLGGSANRKSGYKQTMQEYSMMRDTVHRSHDGLGVQANFKGELNVNTEVRNQVSQGETRFAAIDYGNVSDNYHRALYQNKRGGSLFSVGLDFLTPQATDGKISLFDKLEISGPEELGDILGDYMVASHAIVILPSAYYEKFETIRKSANTEVGGNTNFDSQATPLYKDD